jgi:endonuclease/exonuclease/phosphatase family metal-dependent hydrolase
MKSPLWLACLLFCALPLRLAAAPKGIIVATYNLQNYVAAETIDEATGRRGKPKEEQSIAALVEVIRQINPDILGVCEMGSPERFEDFKKRLAEAGLGYTDSEYVQAADPDRHLALVSRFPITARQSQVDVPFELNGRPEKVRRGFLDVTIQVNPAYQLRMVGVHLKSKLASLEGEALIRRHEAHLLRRHLEKILATDSQVNLLCYGDFNDTKEQPAIAAIAGVRGTPAYMDDLPAADEGGDKWTHYWKEGDLYARIDYLFASRGLLPEIAPDSARVFRSEHWQEASDHRAVYATIVPVNRK